MCSAYLEQFIDRGMITKSCLHRLVSSGLLVDACGQSIELFRVDFERYSEVLCNFMDLEIDSSWVTGIR